MAEEGEGVERAEGGEAPTFLGRLDSAERSIYDKYAERLSELNEMWREYCESASRTLGDWEIDKVEILERLSKLTGYISRLEEEINELYVKAEIGLIDRDSMAERVERLEAEKRSMEERIEALRNALEEIERRAEPHRGRVLLALLPSSREEIEEKIRELEERYQRGEISEGVYSRTKSELSKILKYLEG